ncbi:heterodisulfide reductase-related iron-sulfur binding cluster [Chloroflexota bacterium]
MAEDFDYFKDTGIIKNRSMDEQAEHVRKFYSHALPMTLRQRQLWGAGIERKREKAENIIFFGCYRLARFPQMFRRYFDLLDHMGIDYTFLDKEYCCGAPLVAPGKGPPLPNANDSPKPGAEREKAEQISREFMGKNIALAKKAGGRNMVWGCVWCTYIARNLCPDTDVSHLYLPDILLSGLNKLNLKTKPTVIGFYQGCHGRSRRFGPAKLNLQGYRDTLEKIKGLKVVDLPHQLCCQHAALRIIEEAEKLNINTIVSPCGGCHDKLINEGKGRIQARFYIDFVCDVVGIPL